MSSAPEISLQTAAFADDFIDVSALNEHVSARLAARIDEVRARAQRGERSPAKAFAVLGAAGGGKTHIFARLRHHAGLHATLILLRPFFGVSLAPRDVLATLVDQLCLPVRGGALTQLDVLAAHWLGDRDDAGFPSAAMEDVRALSAEEHAARIDRAVADVLRCLPEAEPAAHLARALFTLGPLERSARWTELAWLSGREPRRHDGAPLSEADVAHLLRIASIVAAPVAPLVLTFDQLENLAGDGDARVLGYGNLVAELVDTVPSLTIAQLALTSEWMQFIEPRLTLPQKTRVAGEVLTLDAPDRAEREQLLRAWHAHLGPANGRGGKKRFPSPLAPEDLEALLGAPGMTPRLLLAALARAVSGKAAILPPTPPTAPPSAERPQSRHDAVWHEWEAELARTQEELGKKADSGLAVDAAELAEGLTSALSFVPALELATRTERDRVLTEVRSASGSSTLLYVTGNHHKSVGTALAKAIELAQLGKAVVVREKRLEVPTTWESVQERRVSFERLPNARWLGLERDDVARLLTLARLSSRARAGRLRITGSEEGLTEAELRETVRERTPPHAWRPTVAITGWLSDIPRERIAPPEPPSAPRSTPRVAPAAETAKPGSALPAPTFGDWLRLGGQLGKAAVSRYADRLRGLRGRGR